jgi:small subunit ribosomal protein S2
MNTDTHNGETKEVPLIERLFGTGAHFGFAKSRRHPTAAPYIFGNKQGTDIIDLEATIESLEKAKTFLKEAGKQGKAILFVGTKEETAETLKGHAEAIDAPIVVNRWVGGMLTNFSEIKKRIARLGELTQKGESGELERKYTKKELVLLGRELNKLSHNFDGIKDMERLPQALVVVDPRHNSIAIKEANALSIPVVGIANSDANMNLLAHPIVVNDGMRASVSIILEELVSAYEEGKTEFVEPPKKDDRRGRRN